MGEMSYILANYMGEMSYILANYMCEMFISSGWLIMNIAIKVSNDSFQAGHQ